MLSFIVFMGGGVSALLGTYFIGRGDMPVATGLYYASAYLLLVSEKIEK